jgi:asparagine synthase (glutamine-hydrolysing)
MCGIAVYGGRMGAVDARLVSSAMSEALIHRGPDDEGSIVVCVGDGEQRFALAHRRLSIIDLSTAGRQPMAWDGGRLQIIYNGEIYNYVELREELRGLGHQFRTATDTEVILAAYAQWGEECLQRFNGMWAFALWDATKRELFCAVDRSGIKPFYYWSDDRSFAAASEIKALLKVPGVPSRPSSTAVLLYLESTIDHVPGTTFFEGISRLSGGHSLRITSGGVSRPQRWWRPSVEELPRSEGELAEMFFDVLRDSIRLRFRSDVPVGVNLSGGVDSSAILYVTADLAQRGEISLPQGLRAFTASAGEEEDIDEAGAARRSALQCGAQHYVVAPSSDDLSRDVNSLVWHQDEPFGSLSTFMQFAVMRLRAGAR